MTYNVAPLQLTSFGYSQDNLAGPTGRKSSQVLVHSGATDRLQRRLAVPNHVSSIVYVKPELVQAYLGQICQTQQWVGKALP